MTAPAVTVCIPVFRPGRLVEQTLESVQRQTFDDFKVLVAIEPTGNEFDQDVLARFAADARFTFFRNPSILGWAGNVDGLVRRVDTDFFAFLPEDDLWEPNCLAALVHALAEDEDAAVAYSDVQVFDGKDIVQIFALDNSSLGSRLFSFYLSGAEGHPWRGLTRRRMLPRGVRFPQTGASSFAVECEWSQQLLCLGNALRVPGRLYRKRSRAEGHVSVSHAWQLLEAGEKRGMIEIHRQRMLAGIPPLPAGDVDRDAIVAACEVAMLRRLVSLQLHNRGLDARDAERAASIRSRLAALDARYADPIAAALDKVLWKLKRRRPQRSAVPAT